MSKDVDSDLEWGAISSNINEAASRAEELGRDDVYVILEDAFSEFEKFSDKTEIFEYCYEFSFHMRYRKYDNLPKEEQGVNKVSVLTSTSRIYRIDNYDFKMFIWAKDHGFGDFISNNAIEIPADKLSQRQIANFDARLKHV